MAIEINPLDNTIKINGQTKVDLNDVAKRTVVEQNSTNIKEWQEQTFPDWISDDGTGTPFAYNKFAIVRYTNGNNYVSLVDNNDEEPTTGSNWKEYIPKATLESDITVTVGTGGDYSTINEAIEYLTKTYTPTYRNNVDNFKAEILIKTGYIITEQVIISGVDLGWITLSAEDNNVLVDRSALTINVGAVYGTTIYPCFSSIKGAKFPLINNFTIDGQVVLGSGVTNDSKTGYFCSGSSSINGVGTIGAIQFSGDACHVYSWGNVSAYNMTNSSDSGNACHVYLGGNISAITMTNSSDSGNACHVYSGGNVSAYNMTNSSSGGSACLAHSGSNISAYSMVNTSDNSYASYVASGGNILARTITNISSVGISCYAVSGNISAHIMENSSDSNVACYTHSGSNISAHIMENSSDSNVACYSRSGGNISAHTLTLSNSSSSSTYLAVVDGSGMIKSYTGTWTNNGTGGKCNVAAGTISSAGYVNRIG